MGSAVKNHALIGLAVSLLLLGLFVWWFSPGWMLTAAYVLLSLIALLSVPIIYRVAGYSQADEVDWLAEREAREHLELTQQLREAEQNLLQLDIEEGVQQAKQLTGLLEDYHAVVENRFIGKKHMPLEYLGAARRVQKQAVQNLSDIVGIGHSISSIDSHSPALPINEQGKGDEFTGQLERSDKHTQMYAEQKRRTDALLDENRQLFDSLTETAVEVANIRSFSKYERIDTLARLVSLAEIASNSGR